MIRSLLFTVCIFIMSSCDPADLEKLLGELPLSNEEASLGLKEALEFGVGNAVNYLSVKDGYYKSVYKILLPEEAQVVTNKLQKIPGFGNVEEVVLEKINRAAEDAAKDAGPIFVNAIKQISFNDAMQILMGENNAATQYLHNTTYNALYDSFNPVITNSMNKFNALEYWADAVNTYNKIPFVDKINPDLAAHIANSALDGLFQLIEKKELGIRSDIDQRTTALLKKVFAKQDRSVN